MRGHASYAYNRVISKFTGDICKEVIEAAEKDEGYHRVAETREQEGARDHKDGVQVDDHRVHRARDGQNVGDPEGGHNDHAQGPDQDSGAYSDEEDTAREREFVTQWYYGKHFVTYTHICTSFS